jgi:hypothetical protein
LCGKEGDWNCKPEKYSEYFYKFVFHEYVAVSKSVDKREAARVRALPTLV